MKRMSRKERKRKEAWLRRKRELAQQAEDAARTAKQAYADGDRVLRYQETLSRTIGEVVPLMGAFTKEDGSLLSAEGVVGTVAGSHGRLWSVIEAVESEGWTLVHADHVFQPTHSASRDKFWSSGGQQAVSGRLLGIYTFRRVEPWEAR